MKMMQMMKLACSAVGVGARRAALVGLGAWACVSLGLGSGVASGAVQPAGAAGGGGGEGGAGRARTLADLPPMLSLGARALAMSQRVPTASVVVIAEDGASYRYAISKWRLTKRFPVLIDDGTWAGAERIARFVRAFGPTSVVRVRVPAEAGGGGAAGSGGAGGGADAAELDRVIASAWTIRADDDPIPADRLGELWKKLSFEPFGVVVADPKDPTWTAAVALAAGHGQPVVWVSYPAAFAGNIGGALTADQLRELNEAIVQRMRGMGLAFEGLGTDIDALTLCFDGPTKVSPSAAEPGVQIALSDCLGRVFDDQQRPTGQRWGWCGQIVGVGGSGGAGGLGGESSAAYDAMCSLFLRPRMAWLFDGYEDKEPWNAFDSTRAATELEKIEVRTVVDDGGRQGAEDFRRRAWGIGWPWRDREARAREGAGAGGGANERKPEPVRRGIDAELVMVNSSGNPEFFNLSPGQGRPGDLPFLRHPAAVYFVHSWSAANVANVEFVAGRWRQRGAYAYCGSVHEPYLQGFVPTPVVAGRLAAGAPWGAAVRLDQGAPWKILCLGDPLMLVRGEVPRMSAADGGGSLGFAGLTDLAGEMALALRGREFERALRAMVMLGRDRDAVRLLAAIMAEEARAAGEGDGDGASGHGGAPLLTAEVALAGLSSAYFEAESAVFARVIARAMERVRTSREWGASGLVDKAWHAMSPRLDFLSAEELGVLERSVRGGTRERDAAEIQRAAKAVRER